MPETLNPGSPTTLVQNRVYAMPARRSIIFASAPIEASFSDTTGFAALTNANVAPGVETALPFIRSTGTGTIVIVKTS